MSPALVILVPIRDLTDQHPAAVRVIAGAVVMFGLAFAAAAWVIDWRRRSADRFQTALRPFERRAERKRRAL